MYNAPDMWLLDMAWRPSLDRGRQAEFPLSQSQQQQQQQQQQQHQDCSSIEEESFIDSDSVHVHDHDQSSLVGAYDKEEEQNTCGSRPMSGVSSSSFMSSLGTGGGMGGGTMGNGNGTMGSSRNRNGGMATMATMTTMTLQQQHDVEEHVMESRKDVLRAQQHLSDEIATRVRRDKELANMKMLFERKCVEMQQQQRAFDAERMELRKALDLEMRRSLMLEEERREAYALLTMQDAAANMRLKAWRKKSSKAKGKSSSSSSSIKKGKGIDAAKKNNLEPEAAV